MSPMLAVPIRGFASEWEASQFTVVRPIGVGDIIRLA